MEDTKREGDREKESVVVQTLNMTLIAVLSTWSWPQCIGFVAVVLLGVEILRSIVPLLFTRWPRLTMDKGKHLEKLSNVDLTFICFNTLTIVLFSYHALQYVWASGKVVWALNEVTIVNSVIALPLLYM